MVAGKPKLDALIDVALASIGDEMPEGTVVGSAMLVLEVRNRAEDMTSIYTFSSDKRVWIQRALVREALDAVENDLVPMPGDEDE